MKTPSLRWFYLLAAAALAYMMFFKLFADRLPRDDYVIAAWGAVVLGLVFLGAVFRVSWQEEKRRLDFERAVKRMGAAITFLNTGEVNEEFGIRDEDYALYVLRRSKEFIPGLDITFFEEQVQARLSTLATA